MPKNNIADAYDDQSVTKKGRTLLDEEIAELRKLITERFPEAGAIAEIDKGKKRIALRTIAKICSVDTRTVGRYLQLYQDEQNHSASVRKSKKNDPREMLWAIFYEGIRLISTPVPDMIQFMSQYIPRLNQIKLSKKSGNLPLASNSTYYNKAMEVFDIGAGHSSVRAMHADQRFKKKIENCLKNWEPGTVGLHAITLKCQISKSKCNGRKDRGGSFSIVLMIERKLGNNKEMAFSVLPTTANRNITINEIKEFLKSLTYPPKLVRLVTDKDGKPTAVSNLYELENAIGSDVKIELDEPSKGLTDRFRIPGRFTSKDELIEYLQGLMNHGYKYKRAQKSESSQN